MQLLERCDVRSNTLAQRAENLTGEQIAWLDELAKEPVPEPVEASDYILDKVASEVAITNAHLVRKMEKDRAAEAAERAREE